MLEATPIKYKRKNPVVIIAIIISFVVALASILFFIFRPKEETLPPKEEVKLVLKTELVVEVYSSKPSVKVFFESGYTEGGNITIDKLKTRVLYLNEKGQEVKQNEATDYLIILKTGYSKKEIITELGEYPVTINYEGNIYSTVLKVVDSQAPNLKLKKIALEEGQTYKLEDFIDYCSDNYASVCSLKYQSEEMASFSTAGTHKIVIVATDTAGNSTEKTMMLVISEKEEEPEEEPSTPSEGNTSTAPQTPSTPSVPTTPDIPNAPETPEEETPSTEPERTDVLIKETDTYQERLQTIVTKSEKYGTIITRTLYVTYKLFPDDSYEIIEAKSSYFYESKGFNATTKELEVDARAMMPEHANFHSEVVSITNGYRFDVGVPNLVYDYELSVAATIRALEIAYADYSHTRPNGSDFSTAASEIGYTAHVYAENIAVGQTTPAWACQAWKDSPPHYEAMIHPSPKKIGVGYVFTDRAYWVQLFSE